MSIDKFCKTYQVISSSLRRSLRMLTANQQITLITNVSDWQEEHTRRTRKDHDDLVKMISEVQKTQEVESHRFQTRIDALSKELEESRKVLEESNALIRDVRSYAYTKARALGSDYHIS